MSKRKPLVHVVERSGTACCDVRDVFRFFERPSNLHRVTPETAVVSMERHPADLRPGSVFGYRLHRWPLDIRWEAVVSEYAPPGRFKTVKSTGYFPKWALAHEFESADGGKVASVRFRLEYEVPSGLSARLGNERVIRPALIELIDEQLRGVIDALAEG